MCRSVGSPPDLCIYKPPESSLQGSLIPAREICWPVKALHRCCQWLLVPSNSLRQTSSLSGRCLWALMDIRISLAVRCLPHSLCSGTCDTMQKYSFKIWRCGLSEIYVNSNLSTQSPANPTSNYNSHQDLNHITNTIIKSSYTAKIIWREQNGNSYWYYFCIYIISFNNTTNN